MNEEQINSVRLACLNLAQVYSKTIEELLENTEKLVKTFKIK